MWLTVNTIKVSLLYVKAGKEKLEKDRTTENLDSSRVQWQRDVTKRKRLQVKEVAFVRFLVGCGLLYNFVLVESLGQSS